MKLLFLFVMTFSLSGYAEEIAHSIGVEEGKTMKWLQDKGPCHIARGKKLVSKSGSYLFPEVLCVVDGTVGKGSGAESTGCSAIRYNLKSGTILPLGQNEYGRKFFVMSKKDCGKGGLNELLNLAIATQDNKPMVTVLEAIKSGKGTEFQDREFLFYSHPNVKKKIESMPVK